MKYTDIMPDKYEPVNSVDKAELEQEAEEAEFEEWLEEQGLYKDDLSEDELYKYMYEYKDEKEYRKDPYRYNGVSKSDFI